LAEELDEEKILLHMLVESLGSPGVVADEATARTTPCKCYVLNGSEICFSKGVIGALSPAQKKLYCNPKIEIKPEAGEVGAGIIERIKKFREAAKVCKLEIEDLPKGERLHAWLSCMGRELAKRGIEI